MNNSFVNILARSPQLVQI